MFKFRIALFIILLAFISLAGPITPFIYPVKAQSEASAEPGVFRSKTLEMTVKAGFGKVEINYYSGIWVPFRIMIANQGEPITGRLVVTAESQPNPNPQLRNFVKDVQIPTGSRQFHEIPVYLSSGHKDPVINLVSGGEVLAGTTIRVERNYGRDQELDIAVVDTDSTTLNNLTSADIYRFPGREPFKPGPLPTATAQEDEETAQTPAPPPTPGPQGRRSRNRMTSSGKQQGLLARLAPLAPEDLPRDYVSYDALDVVVIGDAPLSQLSEEQARALRLWVASGGLLIVTGAADVAGLRALGLDSLLPVEAQGAVSSPGLAEFTGVYGGFDASVPALIMSAQVRPGARTLIGSEDRPLVAERNFGSGLVRFVAYNPKLNPFRGWVGTRYLWTDLLLPAAESKPRRNQNSMLITRRGGRRASNGGIEDFLFELAEIEPPSANYFLLFLVAYLLIVGPANYLILRWMRKLDLAWLTIPSVIILFTVVSVAVAQVSRGGNSIAADVSLVELHQSEGISQTLGSLLIMPASKGTRALSFEGSDTYANAADNFNSPLSSTGDPIEFQREPKQYQLQVPTNTWTPGMFRFRSIGEGQPPLLAVTKKADGAVRVKNLGDARMFKAVYMSAEGISNPFDLAPGQESEVSLNGPNTMSFTEWYSAQLGEDNQEARAFYNFGPMLDGIIGGEEVFEHGFFDTLQMTAGLRKLEHPMVIGFVEASRNPMSFDGSIKERSKTFYVIHL